MENNIIFFGGITMLLAFIFVIVVGAFIIFAGENN